MKRIALAVLGAAAAGAVLVPDLAAAEGRLDLRCRDVSRRVGAPAVVCGWTGAHVAGYRLVRAVEGDARAVIFRTGDPRDTDHVDRAVRPGSTSTYAVHAVNRAGRVVASSEPVTVTVAPASGRTRPPARPQPRR